jgi:diguanylate cyclase (GGDEF)-like protein
MPPLSFGTPIRATWPYRWRHLILGAGVGVFAPLGLLLVRAIDDSAALTYLYVSLFSAGALAVLGFRHGRREDHLLASSLTDSLTGLWNRRYLDSRLSEEIARAHRYHTPLSLLAIDVDRLKEINDGAGHAAGDRAIRLCAEALRQSCRAGDVAARCGGDEFIVLAPSTSASEALALARRIRTRLAELAGSADVKLLSTSIGVSDLGRIAKPTAEDLVADADDALYAAKARGGDRVVLARHARTRRHTATFNTKLAHDYIEGEEYTGSGPFILSGSTVTTRRLPRLR